MNQIASKTQLRLSYLRWALVTIPLIVLLGFLSGRLADSGYGNRWFDALQTPALMPPAIVFPIAWTILYILIGLALAMILGARGARGRGVAVLFFCIQFALNLLWSPLFFAAHQVSAALAVIALMILAALVTSFLFGRIRRNAALLMVPYLLWLCFAAYLNLEIGRLNPHAETMVAPAAHYRL